MTATIPVKLRASPRRVFTHEAPFPLRLKKPKPVAVEEPEYIKRFRRALAQAPSNMYEVWKHLEIGRAMELDDDEIAAVIKARVRKRYGGLLPLWVNWALERHPDKIVLK